MGVLLCADGFVRLVTSERYAHGCVSAKAKANTQKAAHGAVEKLECASLVIT